MDTLESGRYGWASDADPAEAEFIHREGSRLVRAGDEFDREMARRVDMEICDGEANRLGRLSVHARALPDSDGASKSHPYRVDEMDGDRIVSVTHGPEVTEEFNRRHGRSGTTD